MQCIGLENELQRTVPLLLLFSCFTCRIVFNLSTVNVVCKEYSPCKIHEKKNNKN